MIRPEMTLSEFLRRFSAGAEVLDDYDIRFDAEYDGEATLEELCDESDVSYWEIEEDLLMLDEQGWDVAM